MIICRENSLKRLKETYSSFNLQHTEIWMLCISENWMPPDLKNRNEFSYDFFSGLKC